MKNMCLGIIVVFLLAISSTGSLAQEEPVSVSSETANATSDSIAPGEMSAIAPEDESAEETSATLQGIWIISLADNEITMALDQSGDALLGKCKFEGEAPWNGVVSGSVSGRIVNIAMAAIQGKVLVSTALSGTVEGDSMAGTYVRFDQDENVAKGDFSAERINPDASEYSPAEVEFEAETISESSEQPAVQPSEQPAVQSKISPFKDVRNLAKGIDPNIMPTSAPL